MMLTIKKQLDVRLSSFRPKLNSEGAKLVAVGLTLEATKSVLRGALAEAAAMMNSNESLESIKCDEEMKSVRLEFSSPAAPKETQVFEVTNLADFVLAREKATEAGTLNKERSGRITVDVKFTVPLIQGGIWAVQNFGDDLLMSIEKAQGELYEEGKEPATADDSQEARNERIKAGEKDD